MRTAATQGQALPTLKKLQKDLQDTPRELQPDCCRSLASVLREIDQLEKCLRKGGTADLLKDTYGFVREMTTKASERAWVESGRLGLGLGLGSGCGAIVRQGLKNPQNVSGLWLIIVLCGVCHVLPRDCVPQALPWLDVLLFEVLESGRACVNGDDVTTLLTALQKYPAQKNFAEMRAKLLQWATNHNEAMRAQELETLLSQWHAVATREQALTSVPINAQKCIEILSKLKSLPPSLKSIMRSCMPLLLRQTATEVLDFQS